MSDTVSIVEAGTITNRIVVDDAAAYVDPQNRAIVDGSYHIGWVQQADDTFAPPQMDIPSRKKSLVSVTERGYAASLERGFTFDGGTFAATDRERQRVSELVVQHNAGRGLPRDKNGDKKTTKTFHDKEGVVHELDGTQIVDLAEAGSDLVEQADDRYEELMGQISAAASQADLDAIDPSTGWPN